MTVGITEHAVSARHCCARTMWGTVAWFGGGKGVWVCSGQLTPGRGAGPGDGATHVRLNHLRALVADSGHKVKDIDLLLGMHHVHHGIDHDEGARPAHARASGRSKDGPS